MEPKENPIILINNTLTDLKCNELNKENMLLFDSVRKQFEIDALEDHSGELHQSKTDNLNTNSVKKNALIIGQTLVNLNMFSKKSNNINSLELPKKDNLIDDEIIKLKPYFVLPFNRNLKRLRIESEQEFVDLAQEENKIEQNKIEVVSDNSEQTNSGNEEADSAIKREQWDHKVEFLLAIIGFSVDLGNIWRFPKVVYENGGGRFLIPYFIQLVLCGLPLFYMELAIGQYNQTGLFTLFEKICPLFKGLAFTAITIDIFMAMFYNTVIAWSVYYLLLSFKSELPWKTCENAWNTLCCFPINQHLHIPKVSNFSMNVSDFQKKTDQGLIYKVHHVNSNSIENRIVIFDTNKKKSTDLNSTLTSIKEFFEFEKLELSNSYYDLKNVSSNSFEQKLNSWFSAYFILDENKSLKQIPIPFIHEKDYSRYIHDSKLLTDLIEQHVNSIYENRTVNLILNCASHLNNPTEEFYYRYLTEMHKSTGIENVGGVKWEILLCLFIVFVTVYFALWKGIKSAGKAVWITATAPYIVMFILLIRGITLEGSSIGLSFYLSLNDWSGLFDIKVWIEAATQIFFSLGPGFGTIIALSSYNKKTNNCYKDALLTSAINCLTSILSGFVVFSTLGHMAHVQGKSIEDVTEAGPGLIFITYPQAISMMPGAPFWAVIFFFMLFTLGIDSTFGGLESVITGVCDAYPNTFGKKRSIFVFLLILVCFLAAIPTVTYGGAYLVHLFDNYAVAPSILIVVFLEVIGVMYAYGCDRFCEDIEEMIGEKPNKFWIFCWKYISPAIIIVMTVMISKGMLEHPLTFGEDYLYTGVGQYLAILIVAVPISFIFIYATYRIKRTKGTFVERIKKLYKPNSNWSSSTPNNWLRMKKLDGSKYLVVNLNCEINKASSSSSCS